MHPHPRNLGATRFFARITVFDLECPRCGKVHKIMRSNHHRMSSHGGQKLPGSTPRENHPTWNPSSSRFHCTGKDGCQATFVLGMLAWDPPRGAGAGAVPADQVPNARQLAALRADGDGWWMLYQPKGRMSDSNIAATEPRPEQEIDEEDIVEDEE